MQEMQGIGLKNIRVQSYDLRSLQVRVVLAVWRHLLEHPLQSIKSHWMRRNAEPKHQWIHHLQDLFSANPHDHRIPDPVALGHPLVMVFCGPALVYHFLVKRIFLYRSCCFNFFMGIISLPLGIIIDPFVWIGSVVYFTPQICESIKDWFTRRRDMIEAS